MVVVPVQVVTKVQEVVDTLTVGDLKIVIYQWRNILLTTNLNKYLKLLNIYFNKTELSYKDF